MLNQYPDFKLCLNIPQKFIIYLPIPIGTPIENEESSDDECIINTNNNENPNVCLNLHLQIEPQFVNKLYVTLNLNIPICYNVPYASCKIYKLGCCYLIYDDNMYYSIINASNIPDASILEDLTEIQFNIYSKSIVSYYCISLQENSF